MKIPGIVQAVILMLLLASAASCEVSKTYFQRTFQTTLRNKPDSAIVKVKFMQIDSLNTTEEKEENFAITKTEKPIINDEPVVAVVEEKPGIPVTQSTSGVRTKKKRTSS